MKKKLVIGITIPGSTPLIKGQAKYFVSRGYDVYLMCPKNEQSTKYCEEEGCNILDISIERYISPFKDVKTLIQIIAKLRKLKPDIVNVGTPKMGLLGAIGAYFVGVRVLIYTCRGLRYEHENGFKYFLLKSLERIPGLLADKIICISNSIREKAVEDGVFKMVKTVVIEKGSSNGIDLNKFDKKRISAESLNNLKKRLGVSNEFIFGFIGRLNDRKGITELYNAFSKLQNKFPSIRLIIVGKVDLKEL
jgi:glycosyltransferase involved in cell wall biosynthesis